MASRTDEVASGGLRHVSTTAPRPETVQLGTRLGLDPVRREVRDWGILFLIAVLVAAGVVVAGKVPVLYAAAGLLGLAYVIVCARRPALGCASLAFATPLIEGLGRGTLIPLVRPSEAMMALLIVGVLIHEIPRRRERNYTILDVVVLAYTLGVTVIPIVVLLVTGQTGSVDTTTLFSVFSPLFYLAIFLLFSRVEVTDRDRRLFLNLAMAASVVVSLVGIAQLAQVPGVLDFVNTYYPPQQAAPGTADSICSFGVCRPASLMQHYSAFGAYCMLSFTVALVLLAGRRVTGFDRRWLVAVLAINAIGVFASETVAAVVGLVLATAIVLLYWRTFPRQLLWVIGATVAGTIAFWGQISARLQQQTPDTTFFGIGVPQSLGVRAQYWAQLFWPDLRPVVWTGTGNVIPSDIPASLTAFVDNEYLGMGFRAGVGGIVLLLVLLGVVGVMGWRARRSHDPLESAVGGIAVAFVIVLGVIGTTAEYLTFAGVDQIFWMVVGMLAGFGALRGSRSPDASIVQVMLPAPAPEPSSPPADDARAP